MEEHVFDLLPAYALGSLDEDELQDVARHLPNCAVCREELATYGPVVEQLPLAVSFRTPPSNLRGKILRQVQQEARSKETPARESRWAGFFRSLTARPSALVFVLVAVLLLALLSISNWILWDRLNEVQARMPAGDMQIVSLEGTADAPDAHGYLMVFPAENYGTLVVEDAPELQPGYQYQLWLISDGQRSSGGVFSVDESGYGTLEITADLPLDQFPSFGVTVEPEGGSPGPTGSKVLGGDL